MENNDGIVAIDMGEPERSADSGTELSINEEWIIESIKQKLQEPSENEQMNNNSFIIRRVDSKLRDGNEDVYTPRLVSIGPYHYGNVKFEDMQDVKSVYFNDLIQRSSEADPVPQYVEAVSNRAAEAKKLYFGIDNLTNDEFVKMMVVDGCFLIEFLLKSYLNDKKGQTDIVKTDIVSDLLLVENQIPFFILKDLFQVYKQSESKKDNGNSPITIEVPALFCFTGDKLGALLATVFFIEEGKSFHHLLHLYHSSLNPYVQKGSGNESEKQRGGVIPEEQSLWKRICSKRLWKLVGKFLALPWLWNRSRDTSFASKDGLLCLLIFIFIIPPVLIIWLVKTAWSLIIYFMSKLWEWIMKLLLVPSLICLEALDFASLDTFASRVRGTSGIPNARYLRNTGFNFKRKETSCLIDVSNNGRTIKIPRLRIQKTTIVRFRNLIALEYSCPNVYGRKFTAYAKFLDYLIDAREDVAILRECDIIDNRLGEDEAVATFFDNLLKGIDVKDDDIPMFLFINKYYTDGFYNYRVWFFEWRKKLVPEYFSNPWAVPSMIAAFSLLVLTVLQTFFTIYPYYKPR